MNYLATTLLAGAAILATASCSAAPEHRDLSDLEQIDGFLKVLERGEIPPVNEPVFVTADEAEIADDAWVIGVFAGGTAKAYAVNLLNRHEVVNDQLDGEPIATTW
jgi:hypothetical protein